MKTENHECYVSLEVAKLLKEAGFDWEVCEGYIMYGDGGRFTTGFQIAYNFNGNNGDLFINYRRHTEVFSKPTLDIAQRWLREVKNIDTWVTVESVLGKTDVYEKKYAALVFDNKHDYNLEDDTKYCGIYNTYEEAQEAGIKKALEIILEKGE